MGQHTAFILNCKLKPDTPKQVIETLEFMTGPEPDEDPDASTFPTHPLFDTDIWEYMLNTAGGMLWDSHSTIAPAEDGSGYLLNIRTSVKDQENQVEKFLHWIVPYTETEGFLGYMHPEYEPKQARILFEKGEAFLVVPVENTPGLYPDDAPISEPPKVNMLAVLESAGYPKSEIIVILNHQLEVMEANLLINAPYSELMKPQIESVRYLLQQLNNESTTAED